jgi:hypothetical protein
MDLNIKLQGLKYNLEKVWGGGCKKTKPDDFLEVSDLFFYWKIYGVGLQPHEPSPWSPAHGEPIFIKTQPSVAGWTTRI